MLWCWVLQIQSKRMAKKQKLRGIEPQRDGSSCLMTAGPNRESVDTYRNIPISTFLVSVRVPPRRLTRKGGGAMYKLLKMQYNLYRPSFCQNSASKIRYMYASEGVDHGQTSMQVHPFCPPTTHNKELRYTNDHTALTSSSRGLRHDQA